MDNQETTMVTNEPEIKPFRWCYILAPAIILGLTLILSAIFYAGLPETTGYMFNSDGTASKMAEKMALIGVVVIIQFLLTLAALTITVFIGFLANRFYQPDNEVINPVPVICIMGNMIALPQGIIFFAMIDIFSYNSYGTHFVPLWLNATLVLFIGGILLSLVFFRSLFQMKRKKQGVIH